ncbi:YeeE/YedE family protein [Imbroritus primus]|uniref:YeeE/YedE family protein n=1 Tax=Imbroritus primus TaxID=3058603 RepID=A0ACD3SSK6_9BURK|nr:YeeE/YedE family protein [Burkholderiaceae bacterium PBA]
MITVGAFSAGLLFGLGLILSGMSNPAKVLGFLDLAGRWDPSLALVMGGAVAVGSIAFAVARRGGRTVLGGPIRLPEATQIDRRLVIGAVLFGMGWGVAGFCPGPAIVGAAAGYAKAWIFMAAMLAGMAVYRFSRFSQ